MGGRLRILVADDYAVVREGLKALAAAQPDMEIVGEAGDGLNAVALTEQLRPDVVVIGVSLAQLGGPQATVHIKRACPATRVVAFTVHQDKSHLRQMLEAGASGYVLKTAAADEIVRAIRRVAEGGTYVDPSIAERLVTSFVRRPAGPPAITSLSEREAEVLRLIALGHSNKEISALLDLSVKTVETYKQRLMEKLELSSRVDIVRYALQRGWLSDA
jgi:DNA-binding NarL/FixJ family response regulator